MIFEIRGCNRRNKGAELMLIAILDHFKALDPAARFAVDQWFGSYVDRAAYGLWVRTAPKRKGRGSVSLQLMPSSLRHNLGIVEPTQIDATLDAAGFAYGDAHGPEPTEALAKAIEAFKRAKRRPFVLLPQAFGPFTTPRIRRAMLRVADSADIIYARDRQSLDALVELCGNRETIRVAPDFTAAVKAERPETALNEKALVIPNARMLDKTHTTVARGYVPLLVDLIGRLDARGIRAEILLHDRDEDAAVARQINEQLGEPLSVLSAEDPRRLKALIGSARLVVASRFHALVGAMSQAVPAIGIGWSHKYEELFNAYGCQECLLSVGTEPARIETALNRAIAMETALRKHLAERADNQRILIASMWETVDRVLGIN